MVGETAAVLAALCWSMTGVSFAFAGRRVGSQVVNLTRLLLALVVMLVLHRVARGTWLPADAAPQRWAWLGLSGVVGLALGDAALFQALVLLGARLGTLMMALAPIIATVLAWIFLGERLGAVDLLAVALTVGGVGWVVLERRGLGDTPAERGHFGWGVLAGLGGALGQALGLILSRQGLLGDYPVISANVMRIAAAAAAVWAVALGLGHGVRPVVAVWRDRRAALAVLIGTAVGPVIGVLLSLVAVQRAPVGIASTLMALSPVLVLPMVYVIDRERISLRALGGTVVALAGVALIFLY